MEANKKYNHHEYTRTSYVEGNTVRKLNSLPDIRREEEQYEVAAPRRHNNKQTKEISGINFASLLVLTAAVIATVFLCVDYVRVQCDINQMDKQIAAKQEQLITLTKNNDAAYENIKDTYDLKYVYRKAVKELGMVYPNKNKVITFHGRESDYVRKNENIPK